MSGCSLHAVNTSLKYPRVWFYFCMILFYFIQASSWEVTCISETAFLPPRTLFLSSPNRRLCSIFPRKCNTSWAHFNEVHLSCFLYEQVLAAHKLQLVFPVYFYYRAVPIAERWGPNVPVSGPSFVACTGYKLKISWAPCALKTPLVVPVHVWTWKVQILWVCARQTVGAQLNRWKIPKGWRTTIFKRRRRTATWLAH